MNELLKKQKYKTPKPRENSTNSEKPRTGKKNYFNAYFEDITKKAESCF